jgi:uncharacterized protein YdhG (YjbR/CyaY superfamily)
MQKKNLSRNNDESGKILVDNFIDQFEPQIQELLKEIRESVKQKFPFLEEKISYQTPTFFWKGVVFYYSAFKNHIGLYPLPEAITNFSDELTPFKKGKGSIQFPITEKLPIDLILRLVEFRIEQNKQKSLRKTK